MNETAFSAFTASKSATPSLLLREGVGGSAPTALQKSIVELRVLVVKESTAGIMYV